MDIMNDSTFIPKIHYLVGLDGRNVNGCYPVKGYAMNKLEEMLKIISSLIRIYLAMPTLNVNNQEGINFAIEHFKHCIRIFDIKF